MKSNTEKEFLENFYKNMNSSIADYKNDNTDDVFYYSFSEIKEKTFMSEESRRNHEIINTHEVFEAEYIYNNFNINRMIEAVESESFKLPSGLSIEEKRDYILNFDKIKENLNSELIIMPDDINTPEDIRQFILSNEDIKLENIADNDKIEVIKSLLDNK